MLETMGGKRDERCQQKKRLENDFDGGILFFSFGKSKRKAEKKNG